MSSEHKRPLYAFATVALLCALFVGNGLRSDAFVGMLRAVESPRLVVPDRPERDEARAAVPASEQGAGLSAVTATKAETTPGTKHEGVRERVGSAKVDRAAKLLRATKSAPVPEPADDVSDESHGHGDADSGRHPGRGQSHHDKGHGKGHDKGRGHGHHDRGHDDRSDHGTSGHGKSGHGDRGKSGKNKSDSGHGKGGHGKSDSGHGKGGHGKSDSGKGGHGRR